MPLAPKCDATRAYGLPNAETEAAATTHLTFEGTRDQYVASVDVFFDVAEIQSWMQSLPRMEVHVFDAGHLMPETHAAPAVALMLDCIGQQTHTTPAIR
jgi:surfactin synthase thioesterase subunit